MVLGVRPDIDIRVRERPPLVKGDNMVQKTSFCPRRVAGLPSYELAPGIASPFCPPLI